jgi:ubiquinone/menaquinone biosynthesis C-methylase UbiE
MIKKFYAWLYRVTAMPDERGEYSGGRLEGIIRNQALELCRGAAGKALEIGFGSGLFVLKLAAQEPGLEVWGVDNNGTLLDQVLRKAADKELSNLRLTVGDAKHLSFPDGTFDRVVCVNLFLNIGFESMAVVLKEMRRVLAPQGRIIFEFRNSRNPLFVLKYKMAKYYDTTAPYPLYTFDPARVENLLRELGLNIVGRSSIGFPVKWLAPIMFIEAQKI